MMDSSTTTSYPNAITQFALVMLLCLACNFAAAWTSVPGLNDRVSSPTPTQPDTHTCSDGAGGSFKLVVTVVWVMPDLAIYPLQLLHDNADGKTTSLGTIFSYYSASYPESPFGMVPDGAGGVIVGAYNDGSVLLKRIAGTGDVLWTIQEIATSAGYVSNSLLIVRDGEGGAIVLWPNTLHRVNGNGDDLWTTAGVTLTTATVQGIPALVGDGHGGVFAAWAQLQTPATDASQVQVVAQHVSASGDKMWGAGGALVASDVRRAPDIDTGAPVPPELRLVPTDEGGAIVAWTTQDILAQRLSFTGQPEWNFSGVEVRTARGTPFNLQSEPDGSGSAFLWWDDPRPGTTRVRIVSQNNFSKTIQWKHLHVYGSHLLPSGVLDGTGTAADLTGTSVTAQTPQCETRGDSTQCTVDATFLVQNVGNGRASSFITRFYLSEDQTRSADDTVLLTKHFQSLPAGSSVSVPLHRRVKLPTGFSTSGKYIVVVIDRYNKVPEWSEQNNSFAVQLP